MKKKGVLSIMMAVAMAANLAGCGSSGTDVGSGEPTKTVEVSSEKEETSSGAEKAVSTEAKSDKVVSDITIAYVPTTMNNPFWTAMMGGIKDAMTDKGMDPGRQLVTVDAESDQATMNNYIYDLINQEVDALWRLWIVLHVQKRFRRVQMLTFRLLMWIPLQIAQI